MALPKFDHEEFRIIQQALEIAAETYDECAKSATESVRVKEQFERQANRVRTLAERIEEA